MFCVPQICERHAPTLGECSLIDIRPMKDIESVTAKDVEVTKTKNEVTASVSWQRKLPMVANASILLDFEASATK